MRDSLDDLVLGEVPPELMRAAAIYYNQVLRNYWFTMWVQIFECNHPDRYPPARPGTHNFVPAAEGVIRALSRRQPRWARPDLMWLLPAGR